MSSSQNARKRKSDEMEPSTPTGSPTKKMKITQPQKQALIDNLQLEITERARQLRAHYALQCSDLKSRIERRINRVPLGMRKMKMGELSAQHQQSQSKPNPPASQPIARSPPKQQLDERPLPALPSPSKLPSPTRNQAPPSQKSRKRKSSAIQIPSDKENHEPDTSSTAPDSLPVQKNAKRARANVTAAPQPPTRATSRAQKKPLKANENPSGVLSPRSHNSRTLPKSPIKDKGLPPLVPPRESSPMRQQQSPSRPEPPSKPQSPFKAAMSGATSAISAFAKRGYAVAGAAGARLTRPLSREKEQNTITGLGSTVPASPTGKMLPPPRPALATLTGANASSSSIPTLSPQRAASQASMHSHTSEQSSTSTNATVVTKPTRAVATKKAGVISKTTLAKKPMLTTGAASNRKGKVVASGSTTGTLSPKSSNAGVRRAPTATARKPATTATTKKTAAATSATGRVLRKRN